MNQREGRSRSRINSPSRRTWPASRAEMGLVVAAGAAAVPSELAIVPQVRVCPTTLCPAQPDLGALMTTSFEYMSLERDDVRKIAVVIVEIQAVADHKFIGDFKAQIINVHLARLLGRFAQQHAGLQTCRTRVA